MATLISLQELQTECEKCDHANSAEGPFKATKVWNNVIIHLKENVDVRNRKHLIKTYERCFVGSDAVDIILEYLVQAESVHQNITREKVTKLCKHFLESNILVDAENNGPQSKGCFEDSTSHYYSSQGERFLSRILYRVHEHLCFVPETILRFSDQINRSNYPPSGCQCKSKGSYRVSAESSQPFQRLKKRKSFGKGKSMKLELGSLTKDADQSEVIQNPIPHLPNPDVLEGILSTEITKWESPQFHRRSSRMFSSFRRSKIPKKGSTSCEGILSHEEKNEIWREVIVQRLLQLMDMPVLENILSCASLCQYDQHLSDSSKENSSVIANSFTKDDSQGSSLDSDPWIKNAIRCLENQSEVISILSHCHAKAQEFDSPDVAYKVYLYKYISELYSAEAEPLLPAQLLDIATAILGALGNGKTSRAIELSQLCFLLIANDVREKIQKLVEFMVIASNPKEVRLEVKTDNRATILNAYTSVLIKSPILSAIQSTNLVSFWLDCHKKVFQVPLTVQTLAGDKINAAELGVENQSGVSFCQKLTKEQYTQQSQTSTEKALRDLTNHVIDDTKTSLRDKKQHLKNLQKNHREVYDKYFSNML